MSKDIKWSVCAITLQSVINYFLSEETGTRTSAPFVNLTQSCFFSISLDEVSEMSRQSHFTFKDQKHVVLPLIHLNEEHSCRRAADRH